MIHRAKKSSGNHDGLRFGIKTVSEANQREHWRVRHERKKLQQSHFSVLWKYYKPVINLPAEITFARHSCKELDSDNLAGAFKHVQDQLAKELGVDDGDGSVKWRYEQKRISNREHYFTVTIR